MSVCCASQHLCISFASHFDGCSASQHHHSLFGFRWGSPNSIRRSRLVFVEVVSYQAAPPPVVRVSCSAGWAANILSFTSRVRWSCAVAATTLACCSMSECHSTSSRSRSTKPSAQRIREDDIQRTPLNNDLNTTKIAIDVGWRLLTAGEDRWAFASSDRWGMASMSQGLKP